MGVCGRWVLAAPCRRSILRSPRPCQLKLQLQRPPTPRTPAHTTRHWLTRRAGTGCRASVDYVEPSRTQRCSGRIAGRCRSLVTRPRSRSWLVQVAAVPRSEQTAAQGAVSQFACRAGCRVASCGGRIWTGGATRGRRCRSTALREVAVGRTRHPSSRRPQRHRGRQRCAHSRAGPMRVKTSLFYSGPPDKKTDLMHASART